jgi:hypothetical protein
VYFTDLQSETNPEKVILFSVAALDPCYSAAEQWMLMSPIVMRLERDRKGMVI